MFEIDAKRVSQEMLQGIWVDLIKRDAMHRRHGDGAAEIGRSLILKTPISVLGGFLAVHIVPTPIDGSPAQRLGAVLGALWGLFGSPKSFQKLIG